MMICGMKFVKYAVKLGKGVKLAKNNFVQKFDKKLICSYTKVLQISSEEVKK